MNTRQKMRQTNHIIRKEMEKLGFYDIVMFPHTMHFKDIWGLWDGVAKIPVNVTRPKGLIDTTCYRIVWLQFKTGYCDYKDELFDFCYLSKQLGLIAEYIPYKVKYKKSKGSYVKHKVKFTPIGFTL